MIVTNCNLHCEQLGYASHDLPVSLRPAIMNHDVDRVVATVIGTLADARTYFPNIILWQLVLHFIFI